MGNAKNTNEKDTPPLVLRPCLSLSAYRKPNITVCLTDADPSRSVHNDYSLSAPNSCILGHRTSSTVRLVVCHCNGAKVALKTIAKLDVIFFRRSKSRRRKRMLDECNILAQLSSDPNVVGLLDTYKTGNEV